MVGVRWMRLRVAQLDQLPEVYYLEPAELNHVSCSNTVTLPKLLGCDAQRLICIAFAYLVSVVWFIE